MKTIKNMFNKIINKIINKIAKTDNFEFTIENDEIKAAETFNVLQAMYFA